MSNIECTACGLSNFANYSGIQGEGLHKARIMIVGDNPNYAEDAKGEYGHGNSNQLLLDLVRQCGLEWDEVYYTPAVKCYKGAKGKVSATQLKACKDHLLPEIEKCNPEFVITLGATALKALTNKAKITEIHGKPIFHKNGYTLLPTFHPSMSLRDPRFWDRIHTDFKRFGRIINGIPLTEHKLNFKRVITQSGFREIISTLKHSRVVAFDLETNGLQMRLRSSKIGQSIFATFRMVYVVEHDSFTFKQLESFHQECALILEGKELCMANGKFDNLWLHYQFGIRFPLTFDTMLSSYILDENSPNGLKQNAMSKLDMQDWDIPLDIKKGKCFTEEDFQLRAEYAAWDGYATIRLYKYDKAQLAKDPELESLFRTLVMPVARAYERLEINGVHIDLERLAAAEIELSSRIRRVIRKLNRYIGPWRLGEEINWNSGPFVNKVLFDWISLTPQGYTDGGAPSTAEDNLLKMKEQHPIINTLLEYRGVFKQLSSFVHGWQRRMIGGKLYPGYKIHGAVTGRPSCSNPNLQQVPRDPYIRSLVGAPKGWVFFEVDYSQVELRVAAVAANEPTMLQTFRIGGDIHEETYQTVMGISTHDAVAHIQDEGKRKAQLKEERKKAKAVNFGFIYGMGWKTFREYAEAKYGLIVSDSEAKAIRIRYFEKYSGLIDWHKRQRRIVHSMGSVRTLTGRKRNLPQINSPDRALMAEAERQAINSPVQGFGAEMILMALIEVDSYFNNGVVKPSGTIHDAIVGLVREDVKLSAMARVKAIMEDPKIMKQMGISLPLPVIADVSLGNWGIAREYDASELPEPLVIDHG
jgi:uracil-DNA glycosylase family 4